MLLPVAMGAIFAWTGNEPGPLAAGRPGS
jgi:hypothetical protein